MFKRFKTHHRILSTVLLGLSMFVASNAAQAISPEADWQPAQQFSPELESVLKPLRHAQSEPKSSRGKLRSRSEVVQEVKRRYKAEVLKISLNKNADTYRVRVLMPNGKVRNLQVRAYN